MTKVIYQGRITHVRYWSDVKIMTLWYHQHKEKRKIVDLKNQETNIQKTQGLFLCKQWCISQYSDVIIQMALSAQVIYC